MNSATRPPAPKLLAPAGSLAAVEAVLAAGADAVYVGVRGLSREGTRGGMALSDIARAATACSRTGAQIQAALNTVPAASGIRAFIETASRLGEAGVGTLVLNDPGVIALVRHEVPGVRICASVGLSALNAWDARFLKELGADAVVLPTAVRAEEAAAIKKEAGIETEVFLLCRAEAILHGKCALAGYALPAGAPAGAPARTPSAKRDGRCGLVCRAVSLPGEPHSIEEDLVTWVRAGVDAFKVQGRDLPPYELRALIARLRSRLDAAIAEAAGR